MCGLLLTSFSIFLFLPFFLCRYIRYQYIRGSILHIATSIHASTFITSDTFINQIHDTFQQLHALCDYTHESRDIASWILSSLCHKLANEKLLFGVDYGGVEWVC